MKGASVEPLLIIIIKPKIAKKITIGIKKYFLLLKKYNISSRKVFINQV
tara:strand:+ start:1740 stop:1886 length:147 start_codon:yes stop_codon:yes gene_type:complete